MNIAFVLLFSNFLVVERLVPLSGLSTFDSLNLGSFLKITQDQRSFASS